MEVVLRVKRRTSEEPIDYISIKKKAKTFEDLFGNLALGPKIVLKRMTDEDRRAFPLENEFKKPSFENRRKEARKMLFKKFRGEAVFQEDLIFYNGVPLKTEKIDEEMVVDEYFLCEKEEFGGGNNVDIDLLDEKGSEDEFDSEDSNCENDYKNDYPDESESCKESEGDEYRRGGFEESESSENYEEYENEYENYEVYE